MNFNLARAAKWRSALLSSSLGRATNWVLYASSLAPRRLADHPFCCARGFKSIILGTLVFSVGCVEKAKPINPHAGKVTTEVRAQGEEDTSANKNFEKLSLNEQASIVLEERWIRDVKNRDSALSHDQIMYFNQNLIKAIKSDQKMDDLGKLLDKYQKALLLDCEAILSSCPGILLFRRLESSYQIALELVRRNSADLNKYYQLLGVALELKNRNADPELAQAYLQQLPQYVLLLRHSGNLDRERRLMQARNFAETILSHMAQSGNISIMQGLDLWALMFSKELNLSITSKKSIAKAIVSSKPLSASDIGKYSVETESSYFYRVKIMQDEQTGVDFKSLGLVEVRNPSVVFRILDLIFCEVIESEVAIELLRGIRIDDQLLMSEVNTFLRGHFLYEAYRATDMAKKLIFEREAASNELLHTAIRQSPQIGQLWNTFSGSLLSIQKVVISYLREQGWSESGVKKYQDLFLGLDKTIKISVVYPHLMALMHRAGQKRYVFKSTGGREYDSTDFIIYLFNGDLPFTLEYSADKTPLSRPEFYAAFDFGVRSGIFKKFSLKGDDFIADSLNQFGERVITGIELHMDRIRKRYSGAKDYNFFRENCAEFKGRPPVEREIYIDDLRFSPYYNSSLSEALSSMSSASGVSPADGRGIYIRYQSLNFLEGELAENMERLRLDVDNMLRMAEAMMLSWGLNEKSVDDTVSFPRTKALIKRLKDLRRSYIQEIKTRYQDIGFCFHKVVLKDNEIKIALVRAERAYLRQVWRDMQKLRSTSVSPQERQLIFDKYKMNGLPGNYTGSDIIGSDFYSYTTIDGLLRMARYMKYGIKTETEEIAPIAPHIRVNFGTRIDDEVDVYKGMNRYTLPLTSETDFVINGLRSLFSDKPNSYISWDQYFGTAGTWWESAMMFLASTARLNGIDGADFVNMDELISYHQEMLQLVNISAAERQLYSEIGVLSKIELIHLNNTALSFGVYTKKIRGVFGLFDFPVKLISEDVLGYNYRLSLILKDPESNDSQSAPLIQNFMPRREGALTQCAQYYQSRARLYRQNYWLKFNSKLDSFLDQQFMGLYQKEVATFKAFDQTLQRRVQEYARMTGDVRPRLDINMMETVTDPLVTPDLVSGYYVNLKQFNRTTDQCYTTSMKCDSFKE